MFSRKVGLICWDGCGSTALLGEMPESNSESLWYRRGKTQLSYFRCSMYGVLPFIYLPKCKYQICQPHWVKNHVLRNPGRSMYGNSSDVVWNFKFQWLGAWLLSRKLTYPPDKAYLKTIFLFPRWDRLISWGVSATIMHHPTECEPKPRLTGKGCWQIKGSEYAPRLSNPSMNLPTPPMHHCWNFPQLNLLTQRADLGNQATGSEEMEPICTKHPTFGVGDLEPIRSGDMKRIAFIVLWFLRVSWLTVWFTTQLPLKTSIKMLSFFSGSKSGCIFIMVVSMYLVLIMVSSLSCFFHRGPSCKCRLQILRESCCQEFKRPWSEKSCWKRRNGPARSRPGFCKPKVISFFSTGHCIYEQDMVMEQVDGWRRWRHALRRPWSCAFSGNETIKKPLKNAQWFGAGIPLFGCTKLCFNIYLQKGLHLIW